MTRPLSGIYKITNQLNGKIYVGQSQNVYEREAEHFTALRRKKHPNKEMQRDWNKNNRGFLLDVIEFCPLCSLNDREKYWIEELNTIEKGYNQGWVPYKRKKPQKPAYRIRIYRRSH